MLLSAHLPEGIFDYKQFFEKYPSAYIKTVEDGEFPETFIVYDDGIDYGEYDYNDNNFGSLSYLVSSLYNYLNYIKTQNKHNIPEDVVQHISTLLSLPIYANALIEQKEKDKHNAAIASAKTKARDVFEEELNRYTVKN